jgi:hypothetical protein
MRLYLAKTPNEWVTNGHDLWRSWNFILVYVCWWGGEKPKPTFLLTKWGASGWMQTIMNQRMTLGNVTQSQLTLYIYFATVDGLSNKTIIIHQFQVIFSHLYLSAPINNFFLDVCTNSIQNEYFFCNDMDYWKKSCF